MFLEECFAELHHLDAADAEPHGEEFLKHGAGEVLFDGVRLE